MSKRRSRQGSGSTQTQPPHDIPPNVVALRPVQGVPVTDRAYNVFELVVGENLLSKHLPYSFLRQQHSRTHDHHEYGDISTTLTMTPMLTCFILSANGNNIGLLQRVDPAETGFSESGWMGLPSHVHGDISYWFVLPGRYQIRRGSNGQPHDLVIRATAALG